MNAIAKVKGGGFSLQPENLNDAYRLAEMLAGSAMIPKAYQGKPQDTLVAMMMGVGIGLNPIQALQNIAVINGKPAIYGDALLALVQNHPAFGGQEESFDESTMTAKCVVWRKGEATKHTVTFSQNDAIAAGLWGKAGPWKQYPKRMLMWRARGYALRDKFADALNGLITAEEAQDMPVEKEVQYYEEPVQQNEPAPLVELGHYPEEKFTENFDKWVKAIQTGKSTPAKIISMVESKGALTNKQKEMIKGVAA